MEWINYMGLLTLTWGIVKGFGAAQFLKGLVNIADESTPKKWYTMTLRELFNCCLCLGFWVGLIYYQNILFACLVSIGSETFSRLISYIYLKLSRP